MKNSCNTMNRKNEKDENVSCENKITLKMILK